MHHRLNRRALAVTLAAGAAAVTGLALTGCDSTPSVVRIGVVQPLSGNLGALGQDMLNGVKLAVDELNRSGFRIKGKTVTLEVVAVDDRADAATGKQVAQQLVDAGVVAVIGHLNSGVSIETVPIYASRSIPQLAISTNPRYTQLGLPTTFRLVANDNLQARAIGSFASSQMGAQRFAVVDDGTPYGKGLADGAAAELRKGNKDIAVRESFDDKTTAFDALAMKLRDERVEAIVSTLNDFQVKALLEALARIGYSDVAVLGGDTLKTTAGIEIAPLARKGFFASSPIVEPREFPAGARFLDAYRAAFKVEPAYGGHYSYDATHVLTTVMRRVESADPKKITGALRSVDGYAPVTGSMRFDDRGEQRYGVIGIYTVRNGRWESKVRSDQW